jgi:hypothetical protein
MSRAAHRIAEPQLRSRTTADTRPLAEALRAAGPPLLFGLRSWASVSLGLLALRAAAGWLPIPRQGEFAASFAAAHDTSVVSKLMPWVLGNLWPNAARGERLMRGKVIPPGDKR